MSVTLSGASSSSAAALAATLLSAAVDMEDALAQQPNLALMWHLLYDPQWQVGIFSCFGLSSGSLP